MKTNDNARGAESMKIEHEQGTVSKFQDFTLMANFREINSFRYFVSYLIAFYMLEETLSFYTVQIRDGTLTISILCKRGCFFYLVS